MNSTHRPTMHDPNVLPAGIPAPQDDGGARHLTRLKLPSVPLAATDGSKVDLATLSGRTVVYIYPRTGVPGFRKAITAASAAASIRLRPRCNDPLVGPSKSGLTT